MSGHSDYNRTVSLKLSEVLNYIGVNERMVFKRRRMFLLMEALCNSEDRLQGGNASIYLFGSQSEGSTTPGLESDCDSLFCINKYNVIKDWSEWLPGRKNLLMIQDVTTSYGYCLLQRLRDDEPLPLPISYLEHIPDNNLSVRRDKVLLKNTCFGVQIGSRGVRNGPAVTVQERPGFAPQDIVTAFNCKSWPIEAEPWLVRYAIGRWPTEEMKRFCKTTGCFVVPVSSKSGLNEETEWRISTSQAERYMMFSLNITQLQCYILMKMILKKFIQPNCDGVISSYMCKTVLFHCIQNTHSHYWWQNNLLACLMHCLFVLQNFVRHENCPHFIIPENNLMAGKISPQNKPKILQILQAIIQSKGHALLEIPFDDLGTRLQEKMNMGGVFLYYQTPAELHANISERLLVNVTYSISGAHKYLLKDTLTDSNMMMRQKLSDIIFELTRRCRDIGCNSLEKSASMLLIPLLSSSLGSVIASHDIYTTGSISPEALSLFSVGLNSDVASSRLKLASALYCAGDMERAEFVLRKTEEKYDLKIVQTICNCDDCGIDYLKPEFKNRCNTGNEELIQHIIALCVRFTRCEMNCVPEDLRYEMLRSTQEDRLERHKILNCWMDWAVADSLPYLYFLQYKTYGALQRGAHQQVALANLATSIEEEESNLRHKETALNLLGQCMEMENRHAEALRCYNMSLTVRARNNAANFHLRRISSTLGRM